LEGEGGGRKGESDSYALGLVRKHFTHRKVGYRKGGGKGKF
jgi:hypothetical protein